MTKKNCPYCEGKNGYTFYVAGTNIKLDCEYCVKGVIPNSESNGLIDRIKNFFGNNDAPENT